MTDKRSVGTWAFSVFICAAGVGVALAAASWTTAPVGRPFTLGWPILAASFVLAERYRRAPGGQEGGAHLCVLRGTADARTRVRRAEPTRAGRAILAAIVTVAVVRRLPPVKLVYNAGQFALDVGIAVLAFHFVLGDANPVEPRGWVAGLAAVALSHLLGAAAVTVVMRIAGAPVTLRNQAWVVGVSLQRCDRWCGCCSWRVWCALAQLMVVGSPPAHRRRARVLLHLIRPHQRATQAICRPCMVSRRV